MTTNQTLTPASELAKKNGVRFPNESDEYRRARDVLLAEEIELRRHIERVAEQRRALPRGGEVTQDYRFEGEHGPVSFADLFGDKQTLVVYSYMYGPERERPCPMCTSLLSAWTRRRLVSGAGIRKMSWHMSDEATEQLLPGMCRTLLISRTSGFAAAYSETDAR